MKCRQPKEVKDIEWTGLIRCLNVWDRDSVNMMPFLISGHNRENNMIGE